MVNTRTILHERFCIEIYALWSSANESCLEEKTAMKLTAAGQIHLDWLVTRDRSVATDHLLDWCHAKISDCRLLTHTMNEITSVDIDPHMIFELFSTAKSVSSSLQKRCSDWLKELSDEGTKFCFMTRISIICKWQGAEDSVFRTTLDNRTHFSVLSACK